MEFNNYYENRNLNLEAEYSTGEYISGEISLDGFFEKIGIPPISPFKIKSVESNSWLQPTTGIDFLFWDYGLTTPDWVDKSAYLDTYQPKIKFKATFSSNDPEVSMNALLYDVTFGIDYIQIYGRLKDEN